MPDTAGSPYVCRVVGVWAAKDIWKYSALWKESAPHIYRRICCSSFCSHPFSKKKIWRLHLHSVCAACIGLLICTGLECIHVKSSFKLSGCSVDHICMAFYFGRLLRS